MDTVKLCFTFKNITHIILEIPELECKRYTKLPLKWLLYLSYTIYGAMGHLSETVGGHPVDYSATEIKHQYFFVSDGVPLSYVYSSFSGH